MSLKCFQWSVLRELFFLYPYADENGRFSGEVAHIADAGHGFLDKNLGKVDAQGNTMPPSYPTFDLEYPLPNLTSYLLSVAVADVRELEQVKITKDGLRSQEHRSWIVASSPAQLQETSSPASRIGIWSLSRSPLAMWSSRISYRRRQRSYSFSDYIRSREPMSQRIFDGRALSSSSRTTAVWAYATLSCSPRQRRIA